MGGTIHGFSGDTILPPNIIHDIDDMEKNKKFSGKKNSEEVEMIQTTEFVVNTENEEKASILPKTPCGKGSNTISNDDAIQIIIQSLKNDYNIDHKKFDVKKLISIKGKVRGDLLQRLISRISQQLSEANREVRLSQVMLDFGPYPMPKHWQN